MSLRRRTTPLVHHCNGTPDVAAGKLGAEKFPQQRRAGMKLVPARAENIPFTASEQVAKVYPKFPYEKPWKVPCSRRASET